MRSLYSHLQSTKSAGEVISQNQKPTFRSSAIFPVLHNQYYSTKILFMGYWLLKRQITQVGLLYTLRTQQGEILSRKYLLIDSPKAYAIEFNEFIEEIKDKTDISDFTGSLEMEIFSVVDLVFPYPAFVLTYYGNNFSTAVHTVGRIYNDLEDLVANEEYKVRESGFDIYGDENFTPFVAFTNGASQNEKPVVVYKIKAASGKEFAGEFTLNPLKPYETIYIKLNKYINLKDILQGGPGTITLGHNFEGFFPRFVVGNFEEKAKSISITHSYYDSSELNDQKSFWDRKDEQFNDSAVMIPVFDINKLYTQIAVYPIFSPSDFSLSFDFYDSKGNITGSVKNYVVVTSTDSKYFIIDFGTIIKENKISEKTVSVNIICNWDNKEKIPTRLKFGLNVGFKNKSVQLPCNICFAPVIGNPNMLKKKGTFKWAPIINIGSSELILTNSSPLKDYNMPANIKLNFYREQDNQTIAKEINLAPHGMVTIKVEEDEGLKKFLNGSTGWLTATADNPFVNGWYFDFTEEGSVAADHFF
ncbi:MAG: hypothetical protein K2X86_03895 [Cytophagaceae bacterium]|nr:hypothetical protein [Cytophagaceae bacterium]